MTGTPRAPGSSGSGSGRPHEVDERLADWVDGTLSPRERERFEAELRVSPKLREQAEGYRQWVERLRGALQAPSPRVDLADRVLAALRAQPPAPAPVRPIVRMLPLLGSLLAAAAIVVSVLLVDAWSPGAPARIAVADVPAAEKRDALPAVEGEDLSIRLRDRLAPVGAARMPDTDLSGTGGGDVTMIRSAAERADLEAAAKDKFDLGGADPARQDPADQKDARKAQLEPDAQRAPAPEPTRFAPEGAQDDRVAKAAEQKGAWREPAPTQVAGPPPAEGSRQIPAPDAPAAKAGVRPDAPVGGAEPGDPGVGQVVQELLKDDAAQVQVVRTAQARDQAGAPPEGSGEAKKEAAAPAPPRDGVAFEDSKAFAPNLDPKSLAWDASPTIPVVMLTARGVQAPAAVSKAADPLARGNAAAPRGDAMAEFLFAQFEPASRGNLAELARGALPALHSLDVDRHLATRRLQASVPATPGSTPAPQGLDALLPAETTQATAWIVDGSEAEVSALLLRVGQFAREQRLELNNGEVAESALAVATTAAGFVLAPAAGPDQATGPGAPSVRGGGGGLPAGAGGAGGGEGSPGRVGVSATGAPPSPQPEPAPKSSERAPVQVDLPRRRLVLVFRELPQIEPGAPAQAPVTPPPPPGQAGRK